MSSNAKDVAEAQMQSPKIVHVNLSDRIFESLKERITRWEFRPGSTVFLVWQQSRSERATDGSFNFGRDVSQLWGLESENMFIVKFTYWLGL